MIEPGHGITTEEAVDILGVKVETAYTETLRGNLVRHGVKGNFDREHIEQVSLERWDTREQHHVSSRRSPRIRGRASSVGLWFDHTGQSHAVVELVPAGSGLSSATQRRASS